jgi:hypothetical protein
MASSLDYTNLTLNSDEARETQDLVFESLFAAPNSIANVHDIRTGVQMDKYIPILGQFGLVGKADPANCGVNDGGQIPMSQKQWTPKVISWRLSHCEGEVPDLLKFWKKNMVALNMWEDIDNEKVAFISDRVLNATYQSILRLTSFGDTTASAVGSGSGSEVLTAGTDATYFTPINGLWKQVFADQAGSALIYRHTIAKNAEATKAAQLALGSSDAYDAFVAMYEGIAPEAREKNLAIQCTSTLFLNYMKYLETNQVNFSLEKLENGQKVLQFRGMQVIERADWDRNIQTYHDLGTTYYLPHRAIMTYNENIPIGTSDTESLENVDSFYDKTDKKLYIDSAYRIDMKILLEAEISVAY